MVRSRVWALPPGESKLAAAAFRDLPDEFGKEKSNRTDTLRAVAIARFQQFFFKSVCNGS
jgi:hypothetical protein